MANLINQLNTDIAQIITDFQALQTAIANYEAAALPDVIEGTLTVAQYVTSIKAMISDATAFDAKIVAATSQVNALIAAL
jgi:hypothetical protein